MAFIGKRTTRRGVVSTALVESCWQDGKLRHRLIANLHGAENLVAALGRLAAEREAVRKERAELELSIPHAEEFYQVITTAVRNGHVWSPDERKEIDRLLRDRKRLLKRVTAIDKQLERIQREGAAIKKHCAATADEIRAETHKHAKKLDQGGTRKSSARLSVVEHRAGSYVCFLKGLGASFRGDSFLRGRQR